MIFMNGSVLAVSDSLDIRYGEKGVLDVFYGYALVNGTKIDVTIDRLGASMGNKALGYKFTSWDKVNTKKKIKSFIAREFFGVERIVGIKLKKW